MRIRVNFIRPEEVCYIGHIDLTRAVARGLRRTLLPLKFTEGFNQRVKLEMGFPLSVGIIGEDEYFDFYLSEALPEELIFEKLVESFKGILVITRIKSISYNAPAITSLNAILTHFVHGEIYSDISEDEIENLLNGIIKKEEIIVERKKKNAVKKKDIRPFLKELKLLSLNGKEAVFLLSVYFTPKGSIKIDEVKHLMLDAGIPVNLSYVVRKRTALIYKGKIVSPMDFD